MNLYLITCLVGKLEKESMGVNVRLGKIAWANMRFFLFFFLFNFLSFHHACCSSM